jgi:competence protein ComEA
MKWTARQMEGSMAIVAVILIFSAAASLVGPATPPESALPCGNRQAGPLVVELAGALEERGVYFLPEKSRVADLMRAAALSDWKCVDSRILAQELQNGMKVTANPEHHVSVGDMDAGKRLLFDIPIDINRATFQEMVLVPGIGEAWARRIIALRQSSGGFKRIEEIMRIKGIKEKKLAAFRKYLYVADGGKG